MAYMDGFNLYYGVKNASLEADRLHVGSGDTELLARFRCAALAWGRVRKEKSRVTT